MTINPRILLPVAMAVPASLLLLQTPLRLLPALLWLPLGLAAARMGGRELWNTLLGFRWMIGLNLVFLLLLPLWSGSLDLRAWWGGVDEVLFITARLVLLIACSLIFVRLASPEDLLDVLETAAEPLVRMGLPARRWVFTLTLAWRMLPVIQAESRWIERARRLRLPAPPRGLARARHLAGLALPVLQAALDRADDLQTALQCRGCDPEIRPTSLRETRWGLAEALTLLLAALWSGWVLWPLFAR